MHENLIRLYAECHGIIVSNTVKIALNFLRTLGNCYQVLLLFDNNMHMHFDLYKNKDAVVDYIEKQRIYTMAVTNLPEIYKKNTDKYSNCKYFRLFNSNQ